MITQQHAINSNLPPVSYTKAIDVWIGACVVFIFSSLIEYAVVNYMGILDEHRQMRKITLNRTRLSTMADTNIQINPTAVSKGPTEKKSLLRKRRKLQLNLQYEDDENMELTSVQVPSKDYFRQNEPDWTLQDIGDLVYVGQRKRVELVRWCSLLSSRGRAERIDIIARLVFPIAFILFNCAYWGIYLSEKEQPDLNQ